MKKLTLTIYLMLLSWMSMGMGFPTIFAGSENTRETKQRTEKKAECPPNVKLTSVIKKAGLVREEPFHWMDMATPAESRNNRISLKVFDAKGNLLVSQQVGLTEVFTNVFETDCLPSGSVFVMFYQNTAYYFWEDR